jgi:hypothetical protein
VARDCRRRGRPQHHERTSAVLLNHFVDERQRDIDAERLGSLEIDNKFDPIE